MQEILATGPTAPSFRLKKKKPLGVHIVRLYLPEVDLVNKISGKFTTTAPLGGGEAPRSIVVCIANHGKLFSHLSILSVRSTRTSWTISE